MGIDVHALQLLKHNQRENGNLGKTITLGRLSVLLGPKLSQKWAGTDQGSWCESLLMQHFGATDVDSIDNSDYEGAKIIFDYNQAIPKVLKEQYDTVLDFGCSEHIFNISQVFKNTIDLCKIGGNILHILPADNFCGHGFYQFTPELFFSIYSESNGFSETKVYLSELYDYKKWYRVKKPNDGERINIRSNSEIYILVVTKKTRTAMLSAQQSDYQHIWNESQETKARPYKPGKFVKLQELFRNSPLILKTIVGINNKLNNNGPKRLKQNKHLKEFIPDEV